MSDTIVERLQRIEEKLDEVLRQMECELGPLTDLDAGIQEVSNPITEDFLRASYSESIWVAKDENGDWFGYSNEPRLDGFQWYGCGGDYLDTMEGMHRSIPWKESKRKIR